MTRLREEGGRLDSSVVKVDQGLNSRVAVGWMRFELKLEPLSARRSAPTLKGDKLPRFITPRPPAGAST